jgi:AcrR family transcriptional regulator
MTTRSSASLGVARLVALGQDGPDGAVGDSTGAAMARQHSRRRLVSNELLEHSARLFATQGYANTSFQDIADAMGISRPALYHYVSNKEEILAALVRDVLERVVQILEQAGSREDLDEDQRVEHALHRLAVNHARNTTRFRLLELFTGLIEDAVQAGRFRPLPARTVALGMLGMANWVAWWYRADHDGDAEAVADVLVDLAMSGVRRDGDRQVQPGPWAALALLKEDVTHLESALSAALPSESSPSADSDPRN